MNKYLKQAIDLAIKNVDEGGSPFGAVLVQGDKVVGTGVNTDHLVHDVSGHAELIAVRNAQVLLQTNDLSDCVMYASGHPCPMCFGALCFVGVKEIYYSNTLDEATQVGLGLSQDIYQYLGRNQNKLEVTMSHVSLDDDVLNPMLLFKAKQVEDM